MGATGIEPMTSTVSNGPGVVYPIDSSWFSLLDSGAFCTVFGAYSSQIVPKFFPANSGCHWEGHVQRFVFSSRKFLQTH